jgi:predicted AAA+ superfamily ATPase
MLTGVHGQAWNASQIGQSLGLSYHTVNSYLDYLVGAFLIRRLPPYRLNIRKRLVKSPKIYWRDSGLLHALLNVSDREALLAQPWVGASWEGFVIEQIIATLDAVGTSFDAFYFRTSDQQEIDLVLEVGKERWAFEIKLTASPGTVDMDRLDNVAALIRADRRYLVSETPRTTGDRKRASCNLPWLLERLKE